MYFEGPNTIYSRLKNNINFDQLHQILTEQAQLDGQEQEITEIAYRCPTIRDGHPIRWSIYTIKTDDDVEYMFMKHKHSEPWTRRSMELCVKTRIATDEIVRRIIPPVVQWPLPENVWWKRG